MSKLLQTDFPAILRQANPSLPALFGKMNLQQMVEHMSDSLRIASGKDPHEVISPEERIPAMQDFIRSEREFKPNTKNALMGEEPEAVRHGNITAAIDELEEEIRYFFARFEAEPGLRIKNPFFGELDRDLWVALLEKHARHHLRQFGLLHEAQ